MTQRNQLGHATSFADRIVGGGVRPLTTGSQPSSLPQSPEYDDDTQLMLRVQADEPTAFTELMDRYRNRLFGLFVRRLGDRQEAEDLIQDVFMRIYRNRRRYQPTAKFTTWIHHIARNAVRNAIRRRLRRPAKPVAPPTGGNEEESPFASLMDRQGSPSLPLERQEVSTAVRVAVATLGYRQRRALELQFANRSYLEIAAELRVTPKAAKSLLYRARTELRPRLCGLIDDLTVDS